MKNWKRFIAACLSVTMVASIPLTAFAESSVSVKELAPKASNESETQEETDLEKILSQEKPYEYFSGLKDQEKLLNACKDEELFQLKEYMKYAYIHESDLKNRQSLDAYLTISEAWRDRNITFEKEEQEQLLQFLKETRVYGTKYNTEDKEGKNAEKTVQDFPTFMEYLQSIKKFDVPKYMELLSAFDEVKTEEDLANAKEAFSNFEEETFGFDEQKTEPEKEDSKVDEQPAKEDKKEDFKAEQSAKKEESKNADTNKKETESTKESAKSATKILNFVDVKENGHQPLQCHIISEKEKDKMPELLPKTVKAKMENGDIVDIDVKWNVDEDPKTTNNTVYTYDIQLPEKYSISDQLQALVGMEQSRLPFIYIKIKEELEKEGHQRPFLREPVYVEPKSYVRAGTNANGFEFDYEIYDITNDGSKIIIKGWAYTPDRNQYGKYQGQAGNSIAATKDYVLNQHPEYQWGGYCLEVRNTSGGVVGSYPLTVTERVDHTELWKGDSRNPTLIDVSFRFDIPLSDLVNKGDLYLNLHYIHPRVGDASFYLMYLASSTSLTSGSYRVDFKADNISSFYTTGVQTFLNANPWKGGGHVTYNGNNLYYSTNDYFYLSNGTWVNGKRSVDSTKVTWFYTRLRYTGVTQSDGWMHRTKADAGGSIYGWIPSTFIQYACSNFRLNVSYNTYTNKIDHWAWGFSKNEGNNGAKNAFKLGSSNFNANFNTSYAMDTSRGTRIPNGYYIGSTFGTSDISGTWTDYSLGTRVTQKPHAMFYEYRYYPHNYKITYNLNGGTNNSANPSTYNVLYGVTLKNPTRSGYKFLGWYEGNTKVTGINQGANASFSSSTDMYNKLAGRRTGNITLTAKWQQLYAIDVNAVLNGQDVTSMDGSWFTFDVYINGSLYSNDVADFCTYFDAGTRYEIKDIKMKAGKKYLGTTYNTTLSGTIGNANVYVWLKAVSVHTVTLQAPRLHAGATWKWDIGTKTYTMNYGSKFNMQNYINVFTAPTGYHYGGAETDDWWETADHDGTYKNNPSNGGSSTFTVTNNMTAQLHYYPNTYTIKYNGNGNTGGSTANSSHTYDVAKALTSNGFTKTGYTFTGWNTKADGTGKTYANKASVTNLTSVNGHTINLYAQWQINTYTNKIWHRMLGVKGTDGESLLLKISQFDATFGQTYVMDAGRAAKIPNGYKLYPQFRCNNNGVYENHDIGKTMTQEAKNMAYVYMYQAINYSISYNLDAGTNNAANPSTYNVLNGVSLKAPTKPGYKFLGWYQGDTKITGINEGKNATFSSVDEMYAELAKRTTGNVSLTAKWTPNKLTVRYHLNGGTDVADDPNFSSSDPARTVTYTYPNTTGKNGLYDITTARVTPPTGYRIKGTWNTKADGSGKSFDFTTIYKLSDLTKDIETGDAVIDLYAQWTENVLTVNYYSNYATKGFTGALNEVGADKNVLVRTVTYPATADCSYGLHDYYTTNAERILARDFYTGTGNWGTKTDGGILVNQSTGFKTGMELAKALGVDITTKNTTISVYPQWTKNKLTIQYHVNGGTLTDKSGAAFTQDAEGYVLKNGKRAFQNVAFDQQIANESNGFFDWNNPGGLDINKVGYIAKKGAEWNTKSDGTGKSFNQTLPYIAKDVTDLSKGSVTLTVYVNWTPKQLVTTFHKNDGSTTTATQTFTYDVAGQKFTDKKWTRTGYTLLGWADSKTATKAQYAILSGVSNAWIEKHYPKNDVYAVWKANSYTITYEGNGATGGSTPSSNHTYDKPQTLTPNGFTKPGYVFDSWNTKPDGTGNSYQDEEEVQNLTSKDGDTITLHAQWKPVDYKIIYKGNGSTSGTEKTHLFSQKDIESNGYVVKTNKGYTDFVRTKHTFMGWYQGSVVNTKTDMAKIYKQGSKLTYSQLLAIHAEQVKKGLVKETDPKVKDIILYAVWDESPGIDTSNMKKSKFYEGVDVTRTELLDGITASDKIDGSLTSKIIITRIDYSAGKLVNGKKQAAYSQTWANGMPADAKLDTWFMQLDKNDSPVTHTITYQVKDSAGNITTAKKTIQVVYNEFPVIKATDFQFELKDAQTGKITKDVLLAQAVTNGIISASDTEDGDMKSKIELIDYDANAFKTMKQEGFVPITYRVQDSMGPGGKGKVTLKTVNVNIFIRYKEETVRYVRFINKKYYEKNANLDRNALAGKYDQIALLSVNGGLHPFSVWYIKADYRNLITETFDKTTGTTYVYTKDDIKKMREFVKQHGVGNAKEEDALSKFADIFMTGDYILK